MKHPENDTMLKRCQVLYGYVNSYAGKWLKRNGHNSGDFQYSGILPLFGLMD